MIKYLYCHTRKIWLVMMVGFGVTAAKAAVTILGTQYQPDPYFPEFDCYWNASAYPGPCRTPIRGATLHVYVKNTGASAVTIDDMNLTTPSATYSLTKIIKTSTASYNPDGQSSIYFYWDNPPADVMAAGEPVWYRFDPPTIGAGGVGRVAVRMRYVPTTATVTLGVVTSAGTVTTNLPVNASVPRVASIGYSDDLKKVYLHWRRSGGAAPTSVWLDGMNVTASTTTVGDPGVNFGASVVSLPNPLPFFSYHVFQGVYADGKTAVAGQRAWTNKFIYATYSTFQNYTGAEWVAEAFDHGFNNVQMNLGIMGGYMGTAAGRADCLAHGYGYTIYDKSKLNPMDPDMWFLNDEPDAEENNQSRTHCGTGYKIPCDSDHWIGTLVLKTVAYGETELRKARPNVPFTVNLDGGLEPESFFTWGPAMDILQTDNYYEPRLKDSYLNYPNRIPLFRDAKFSYAVARTACAGAEPNPSNHLLYSTKQANPDWPYPEPESKRFEAYYSLAGGSKGMGYWWFNPPRGLAPSRECAALWKEMGLVGNEIKTARPLLVISTPVDLALTPGAKVWARALAAGTDTLLLVMVNDNYTNDTTGCHYTAVPNATVTVPLPLWMRASTTAFEISAGGLGDVSTVLNGNQLRLNLGTLNLTKMIVVTTDPTLRQVIQTRYDTQVRPQVCKFAPELCVTYPPNIVLQPTNQTVAAGDTARFSVVASGTSPLNYRWQKNNVNLSDGGHYSGSATPALVITNPDNNDEASYRCVVSNSAGSRTTSDALLTVQFTPVAQCADAVVEAGPTCVAIASVDHDSFDPDGDPITLNQVPPGPYPPGTNLVTLTVTDDHGASNSCNALVIVQDRTPPVILRPANIVTNNDLNVCGAVVTFPDPVASDNCSAVVNVVCTPPSGSSFAVGTNSVRCAATDAAGNVGSNSLTVIVRDTQPPALVCAPDKRVEYGVAWSFDAPVAEDNCGPPTVTILSTVTNALCGCSFAATRTWQAMDGSGNQTTCSQTVTVVDTTPPSLSCPDGKVLEFQDQTGAVASYSVTATDLCSAVSLVMNPPSGSLFPIGVTPVHVRATDACTNSANCSFTVTVLGAQGVKSNVLAELAALRAGDRLSQPFAQKFDEAIQHLATSLASAYWVDQIRLQAEGGNAAINEEKLATKTLENLLTAKRCPVDPAVLQGFVDRITSCDRLLALVGIQDAIRSGLSSGKIGHALTELAKGDAEVVRKHYANAIEHYRNAWRQTLQLRLRLTLDPDGTTRVLFVGSQGKSYRIEASSNAVDWVLVGTCTTDGDGNAEVVDPNAAALPLRFYRAVER